MAIKKKDTYIKWWMKRIAVLKGLSEEAKEFCPDIAEATIHYDSDEDVGSWSFLKLLTLAYYISVYTNIAKKWFEKIVYIDLFAGDGFNYLRGINEAIIGSPVIAYTVPRKNTKKGENKDFDQMILVEIDKKKAQCLQKVIPKTAMIFPTSANDPEVMHFIKKSLLDGRNNHYLAFIDPYAMQIHWNTLKELMKIPGDLIIIFLTNSVQRIWGSYYKEKDKPDKKILDDFFGDERWLEIPPSIEGGSIEDLLQLYISKIQTYREIVIPIKVHGLKGNFCYHMLVATRSTKSKSQWLDAVYRVKEKVEKVTDKDIELFFQVYNGQQLTMDDFERETPQS